MRASAELSRPEDVELADVVPEDPAVPVPLEADAVVPVPEAPEAVPEALEDVELDVAAGGVVGSKLSLLAPKPTFAA